MIEKLTARVHIQANVKENCWVFHTKLPFSENHETPSDSSQKAMELPGTSFG